MYLHPVLPTNHYPERRPISTAVLKSIIKEELEVVKIATMPLLLLRQFPNLTTDQGLGELAKILEGEQENG